MAVNYSYFFDPDPSHNMGRVQAQCHNLRRFLDGKNKPVTSVHLWPKLWGGAVAVVFTDYARSTCRLQAVPVACAAILDSEGRFSRGIDTGPDGQARFAEGVRNAFHKGISWELPKGGSPALILQFFHDWLGLDMALVFHGDRFEAHPLDSVMEMHVRHCEWAGAETEELEHD